MSDPNQQLHNIRSPGYGSYPEHQQYFPNPSTFNPNEQMPGSNDKQGMDIGQVLAQIMDITNQVSNFRLSIFPVYHYQIIHSDITLESVRTVQ